MIQSINEVLRLLDAYDHEVEEQEIILRKYALSIVEECVNNLEADPNPDEPGQWAVMRSSVDEVRKMII